MSQLRDPLPKKIEPQAHEMVCVIKLHCSSETEVERKKNFQTFLAIFSKLGLLIREKARMKTSAAL